MRPILQMSEQDWLASEDPQQMLEFLMGTGGSCQISDRKLRLFACACSRIFYPDLLSDPREVDFLAAIERAEAAADEGIAPPVHGEWIVSAPDAGFAARMMITDLATRGVELCRVAHLLRDIVGNPHRPVSLPSGSVQDMFRLRRLWQEAGKPMNLAEFAERRDVKELMCPWLTPAVLALARGIYEERCFEMLGPMADELEMAGCDNVEFLQHCRGWEQCPQCRGEGWLWNDMLVMSTEPCEDCGGTGWIPLRGPHVRGCHALDLLLGHN